MRNKLVDFNSDVILHKRFATRSMEREFGQETAKHKGSQKVQVQGVRAILSGSAI
jgi:hypothetical protein